MRVNDLPVVTLQRGKDRRIRSGHPWIFSNEIVGSPTRYPPGALVAVVTSRKEFLGIGYINPHSLISIRLLTREPEDISVDFFIRRIRAALQLRQRFYPHRSSYRLVYSESDFLPGLIIDKYNEYLVVQTLTLGMDLRIDMIQESLEQVLRPKGIVLRNDVAIRTLEGLPLEKRLLKGDTSCCLIQEAGLSFRVDLFEGQKTGFFFDQHDNRLAATAYTRDQEILDCFCYTGAWSLVALHQGGAKTVHGIDASEKAIALARENCVCNGYASRAMFRVGNVLQELKALQEQKKRFGVVILDPPAFVKSKQKLREGLQGYLEVNRSSMALLPPGGILITSSCSYHVRPEIFQEVVFQAAQKAGRTVRVLEVRGQAKDHPILLAAPETAYLKCMVVEVL